MAGLIALTALVIGIPAGALGLLLWNGALAFALRCGGPAAPRMHVEAAAA